MIINKRLNDKELLKHIYKAAFEYSKLVENSFLLVAKNRSSEYFWFQCRFEKKNFMHLFGIDSKTLNANEFYNRCKRYNEGKGDGITIQDCSPSRNHSRSTVNEKSSCCADILKLKDAKYMKVGLKDKISQYVDFTYGYGNIATLGFKNIKDTSFPVTLIPRTIDEFISEKYTIIFIFKKQIKEEKYVECIYEIKKGLLGELYNELSDELRTYFEK
ncbi:MAG: hypothetical protein IJA34_03135 [Lachnospiraceae bacterium]|nr:hypothetical protein [Lachnospiraceae bacterium]